MVLSNRRIVEALEKGVFSISDLAGMDPKEAPFNTSAVDLRLGHEIVIPKADGPYALDLRKPGIASFWAHHSEKIQIRPDQPYVLAPNKFVLANTREKVDFPLHQKEQTCHCARVEGKSSLARCGILVHFTAPTIHAGFSGSITLEIINLGPQEFLLHPGMYICQLIVEEVHGIPVQAPNQFAGQSEPLGLKAVVSLSQT